MLTIWPVRDPLLTLVCRALVERIQVIKSNDPSVRSMVDLFQVWYQEHSEGPTKPPELVEPVRRLLIRKVVVGSTLQPALGASPAHA